MAARVRNNGSARRRGQGRRRVTSLAHAFVGASSNQTWTFGYNNASQRISRTSANALFDWTNHPPTTVNKAYDGLNRDAAIAATTGGYDANGNLTFDGTRTFTYDVENRLLTGSAPTAITLSYDPLGRLAQTAAGGATTNFLYDGDRLSAEYDGAGNLLRRYVHGPGVDEPLVWYEGSGTTDRRSLHQDPQGSIVAWSDGAGNTSAAQIQAYGPYGEPQAWSGSRFRYTGQIAIPEAKLYYYKARVYDPATGRFLQTDPVGTMDDLNLYAYAGNDSTNHTDPTGQWLYPWEAPFTVMGGTREQRDRYYQAFNNDLHTPRGQKIYNQYIDGGAKHGSPQTLTLAPGSDISKGAKIGPFGDTHGNSIIDPIAGFHYQTAQGFLVADPERLVAHEVFGHGAVGALDGGVDRMNNVRQNENPIMNALKEPSRTSYGSGSGNGNFGESVAGLLQSVRVNADGSFTGTYDPEIGSRIPPTITLKP